MQNGKYDLCIEDITTPAPVPPPPVALVTESDPDEGGLAGWAISLIIIFVLLFVCCIGYAIAVICFGVANCFDKCFRDHDDTKEIHNNNMYFDDRSRDSRRSRKMLAIEDGSRASEYTSRRSGHSRRSRKMLAIEEGSRASGYTSRRSGHSRAIVMATPEEEDESFRFPDDTFTVDASKCTRGTKSTYGTKHRQSRDPTMYIPGQEDKPDPQTLMITQGRDPTMYIPGQEDKPDLDYESSWFSESNGSHRYNEDPPLKHKREPTMYIDGKRFDEDPSLMPMREPTMYIDGHRETDLYAGDKWEEDYDHTTKKKLASQVSFSERGREQSVTSSRKSTRSKTTKQSGRSKSSYGG